jgi:23S rRNA (pseudouridine1915-N3)-methyltransferase
VEACDDYYRRIRNKLPLDVIELKRAEDVLARLPSRSELWALDAGGQAWSSQELAGQLGRRMNGGAHGIGLLIGGAAGLPASVLARAGVRVSLSRLTLPHRMVRLILAEQLYRALSILRGEPYHK